MNNFEHTLTSGKTFDQAVAAVQAVAASKGFRVLHVHDIAATLTEKGFPRDPLKIIEVCNAKFASQVLEKDVKLAMMLPCPITVYTEGEMTHISTMRPTAMASFFPKAGVEAIAEAVEKAILEIMAEAA